MRARRTHKSLKKKEKGYVLYAIRRSPLSLVGVALILLMAVIAVFAPWIASYDPYKISMSERLLPPSSSHIAGTDIVGRDVFSRVIYGTRLSFLIAAAVVGIAIGVGVLLGALAGFYGGVVDAVIMRITDGFLAIPSFALAMVAAAVFGRSLSNMIWALALVGWTWNARIVRSAVLRIRSTDFMLVQKALGAGSARMLFRHVIPNCMGPILIQASLQCGLTLLSSAGLSFLGLGVQPPLPDWGLMVADGRTYLPARWWLVTVPGIAIILLVTGFLLTGDGIRDIMEREVS
ncbi:MAG: ABC transporter permease [Candidatus Bipolaricaulis sp.]|nr:ABC transporter permease [Candidatus Bipolaricaulis sp.]